MTFLLPFAPWPGQAAPPEGASAGIHFLTAAQAWSTIVLGVAVLGVLAVSVVLLLQLRRLTGALLQSLGRLEHNAAPFLDRSRQVAENLAVITQTVREEIIELDRNFSSLNARFQEVSQSMEERAREFSALLELLQTEAEELALDTAAAVRGMRVGARTLGGGLGTRSREEPAERGAQETLRAPDNHSHHSLEK